MILVNASVIHRRKVRLVLKNTRVPMRSIHILAHPLRGSFINQAITFQLCLKFRIGVLQSLCQCFIILVHVLSVGIIGRQFFVFRVSAEHILSITDIRSAANQLVGKIKRTF